MDGRDGLSAPAVHLSATQALEYGSVDQMLTTRKRSWNVLQGRWGFDRAALSQVSCAPGYREP